VTLRAVGARRGFIFAMIVVEAAVVGILFGGAGAVAGGLCVELIGWIGIPAKSDVMFFFFSGPRLKPFLRISSVGIAAVLVLIVNALSAGYPAWLAARITPRQAMATDE
jgi:ABC-type lipoprotein release transport system permease subunit